MPHDVCAAAQSRFLNCGWYGKKRRVDGELMKGRDPVNSWCETPEGRARTSRMPSRDTYRAVDPVICACNGIEGEGFEESGGHGHREKTVGRGKNGIAPWLAHRSAFPKLVILKRPASRNLPPGRTLRVEAP